VEKLLVDDDIVSHDEGESQIEPSGGLTVAGAGGGEKATSDKSRELGLRRGRRAARLRSKLGPVVSRVDVLWCFPHLRAARCHFEHATMTSHCSVFLILALEELSVQ
jgi:hypothetical protein